MKVCLICFAVFLSACLAGCVSKAETDLNATSTQDMVLRSAPEKPKASPTPQIPDLQAELTDDRNKTTISPIGQFDFKNFTYELPRGWQNPDGSTEITLTNGLIEPIEGTVQEGMDPEEKADQKAKRRIGMRYVTTKYFDVTGDGEDEALVVLKIETGGSAVPQLVYIYSWKDGKPELVWPFRTGDRADGGLKDLRPENGDLVVELYGKDRFLLGQTETGRIGDDIEQLCCPTNFTRTVYKWNGKNFLMQGKRLTYLMADPTAPPIVNMADDLNSKNNSKK